MDAGAKVQGAIAVRLSCQPLACHEQADWTKLRRRSDLPLTAHSVSCHFLGDLDELFFAHHRKAFTHLRVCMQETQPTLPRNHSSTTVNC